MASRREDVNKWLREPYLNESVFKWAFRTLLNRKVVDRESVRWAFRTLLDREPDSEQTIAIHCQSASLTDLVESIVQSAEFRLRYINRDSMRLVDRMLAERAPAPEASAAADNIDVTILQTSDAQRYFPLLACGRMANEQYAISHGFSYSAFVGIKRGYFPWHAAFNRLFMLKELAATGYHGWAFYIDADAYVLDQTFDLRRYLEQHKDKYLIAAAGGITQERWEINDGVFLINLGHPDGRRLVDLWHWHFMAMSDESLRTAPEWDDVRNDQTCLHEILQANPHLIEHILVEDHSFQDIGHGGFVRQVMRRADMTLEDRLAQMRQDMAALRLPAPT